MYTCPVCGWSKLEESPYDETKSSSFEICPSCGTEFGYQDATKSHAELRKEWIEKEMPWWSKSIEKPVDWNPQEQLKAVENS